VRIKNFIHIILFLVLQTTLIVQLVKQGELDVFGIITYLALGIFAYIGLLEIIFRCNLPILLPEFYIESCKNICVNSEINKVASSSVGNIASLLNLTVDEFKLLLSIKKEEYCSYANIKSSKSSRQDDLENKVKNLLNYPLTVTSSNKLISTSMPEIKYYINFLDLMCNPKFSEDIVQVMYDFIKLKVAPERLEKVTYIVIPYDSNLLLGFGVARKLNKRAIKVVKEIPPYHLEKHWNGCINVNDPVTKENCMIIHDTLYSGRQVIESWKLLVEGQNNSEGKLLFFSLCARKSEDENNYGVMVLKKEGFDVYCIDEFDDKSIGKLVDE